MLLPHTSGTRLWSARAKCPLRRLNGTIKEVWLTTPELRSKVSYCYLSRRLRLKTSRLGISAPKVRDDLCTVCHTYDCVVKPGMIASVKGAVDRLKGDDSEYWNGGVDRAKGFTETAREKN